MFRKEIYIPFLLSILLFLSIDISSHNYIVLGKEDDSEDNVKDEKDEDFEERSLDELFDDNNADDGEDNVNDEKEEEKDEKEEKDEVPFILPFNAVPFP